MADRRWLMADSYSLSVFALHRLAPRESEFLTPRLDRNRDGGLGPRHRAIQRIALDRFPSCFGDQANQIFASHALGCGGAGVVINLFFDYGAVDVVRAEAQRD